ncbi:MAG TPA: GYF domain-containing protein, partial [Polyangiaceae bacterium]|nr:GYF domain-containing protein [Polyangiaceae bacterium]HOR35544.1 GYF domain-containing protein [Polyangiaceae bacterium]HPK93582.1 GYF domain-containing protein [Polyangiaceae bacterium]HQM08527.1 GYF domain-containing protein [Polyangiaceae bacterium]
MSNWYVCNEGGDVVGPVTSDLLELGIKNGKVPLSASVCREGDQDWLPLKRVGRFAAVMDQALNPTVHADQLKMEAAPVSSWHLRYEGVEPVGPIPEPELIRSIAAGQVHTTAWVRRVGEQTWVRIYDVPAFSNCWPQKQQQAVGHPIGASQTMSPGPIPNDPVSAIDIVLLTLLGAGSIAVFLASRSLAWPLAAACGIFIYVRLSSTIRPTISGRPQA